MCYALFMSAPTSFRLSGTAVDLLNRLSANSGLKRSQVLELALRRLAERRDQLGPLSDHGNPGEMFMNHQEFEIRTLSGNVLCTVTGTLRTAVLAVCERLSHTFSVLRAHAVDDPEHPLVAGYFDHEGKRLIDRYLYSSSGIEFENWEDAGYADQWLPGEQWKMGHQFLPVPPEGGMVARANLRVDPTSLPAVDAARESGARHAHYGRYKIEALPVRLAGYRYWGASFVVRSDVDQESAPMTIHACYQDQRQAIEDALSHARSAIDAGAFSKPAHV
jgi:hypothetical protein